MSGATPFAVASEAQTTVEALEASVRCAREIPFWRDHLPDRPIRGIDDFESLPLSSRVELSMTERLGDLIADPRAIFRPIYPYHQNVCTFPYQVVAGEMDLFVRHERMKKVLAAAGFAGGGETLILVAPPQYFFASDLCAEVFFEGHHCSLQDVTGMDALAINERIEAFGAQVVIVAADVATICPAAFPSSVEAVVTFRGAHSELARSLDARVVDVYTLTEAPYLGHRLGGERFYRFERDHYYLERSPSGMLTVTSLLWELMPLIRYQTYDAVGEIRDEEGLVEVTAFGEW